MQSLTKSFSAELGLCQGVVVQNQELGEFKMQIGAKFGKQFLTETQDGKEESRNPPSGR